MQKQIQIEGVSLNPRKQIRYSLQQIFGIGEKRALVVCVRANIPSNKKTSHLTAEDVNAINQTIKQLAYNTEFDLKQEVRFNIQQKREINSYEGRRHALGLPCRGQKTRSNARTSKKLNRKQYRN